MVKAKVLREQSVEELTAQCRDFSKQLFQLRNEMKVTRKMEKPHLVRQTRKDRARIMTILRERELAGI